MECKKKYKTDYDLKKLYGRICEKFGSIAEFANAIGRSQQYVSNVLKSRTFLDCDQVEEWRDLLDVEVADIVAIFFENLINEAEK